MDKPVNNSTHIDLQGAIVSQEPLLYHEKVDRLLIQGELTHAALKSSEMAPTLHNALLIGAT